MNWIKTIFLILFLQTISIKAQSLITINQNWDSALILAKQNNKLIIIDFYTNWCYPCKVFSKNLKKNLKLQDELSQNFILLKYDAENDSQYNLTKKFQVRSYPTFVMLTHNIQYIDKVFGVNLADSTNKVKFTNWIHKGLELNNNKKYPKGYSRVIDANYPQFYLDMVHRKKRFTKKEVEGYFASHKNWLNEKSFSVAFYCGATDSVASFIVQNIDQYKQLFGNSNIEFIIRSMASRKYQKSLKTGEINQLKIANKFTQKYLGKDKAIEYNNYYLWAFYLKQNNCVKLEELVDNKMKESINVNEINRYCWNIYELKCNSESLLNKGEIWIKEAVEKEKSFAILDTYGCILYKNKKYNEAIIILDKAIELAKTNDLGFDESKKIRDKCKKALTK